MIKKLTKLKESRTLVSIKRDAIDEHQIQGFLLAFSKKLLLIQFVYDFHLDGLMVLRRSDISRIKSTKTDIFHTQMLKEEGLFSQVNFTKEYDVKNWAAVFSTIGKESAFIIIEDENTDHPIFLIGEQQNIGKKSVSVLGFNGVANWDDEVSEMKYKDINSFQAGNNYTNTYKNYFKRN